MVGIADNYLYKLEITQIARKRELLVDLYSSSTYRTIKYASEPLLAPQGRAPNPSLRHLIACPGADLVFLGAHPDGPKSGSR